MCISRVCVGRFLATWPVPRRSVGLSVGPYEAAEINLEEETKILIGALARIVLDRNDSIIRKLINLHNEPPPCLFIITA